MQSKKRRILPPQYQEVEYLESVNKASYITAYEGEVPKDAVFEIEFQITEAYRNDKWFFGNASSEWCIIGTYVNKIEVGNFGVRPYIQIILCPFDNNRHHLIIDKDGNCIFDGENKGAFPFVSYKFNHPLLFAQYQSSGAKDFMNVRIFKTSADGCFDFMPCYRKADGVAGMYDFVSRKFKPNEGTGSFVVGPDVI